MFINKTQQMKILFKTIGIIALFVWLFFPETISAQCAMCRASLESSGEVSHARGINNGIMYLMAIPYILVAVVGYFVYRKMKQNRGSEE